jgi:hypothetical protein
MTDMTGWEILPWGDGVIVENGSSVLAVTPSGVRELPMPKGLVNEEGILRAGPLGILWLDRARGVVSYSHDGDTWSLTDMPEEWTDLSPVESVVGDGGVLVWLHRCEGSDSGFGCRDQPVARELWLGTSIGAHEPAAYTSPSARPAPDRQTQPPRGRAMRR